MRKWNLIARGLAPEIPDAEVDKIVPALDGLEALLRPQVEAMPYEAEPAVVFEPPDEDSL
ncbi:MAG: hypothetical protein IT159_11705 [Bryobacterales bacterium]|nr:hypothetical protein [Bryobacterales bacterium]